jgi:hypothetical protein
MNSLVPGNKNVGFDSVLIYQKMLHFETRRAWLAAAPACTACAAPSFGTFRFPPNVAK